MISRGQWEADPALTAAAVTDHLGVHRNTAQAALTALRAERMAVLMEQRALTAAQAAAALDYPVSQTRRASVRADAIVRGRQARPYLTAVAQALHARGWSSTDTPPAVQHPDDDQCVATLVLDTPAAPAPALVWSEQHGWRTAPSRRHPLGKGAAWPPPSDGVCHLATGTTPTHRPGARTRTRDLTLPWARLRPGPPVIILEAHPIPARHWKDERCLTGGSVILPLSQLRRSAL
ncbi:hypothetical protein [Streptomyces flaveolus]|uniref:hypothetical protein n=1 Tax=Streptomyces flaveolus TaxID=67297 RepID=UPI0036FBB592